jgi:hypothetical protein
MAKAPSTTLARSARAALLGAVGTGLAGCASPARSEYERHLDRVVAPGTASNDEVAMAFGLDDYQPEMVAGLLPYDGALTD